MYGIRMMALCAMAISVHVVACASEMDAKRLYLQEYTRAVNPQPYFASEEWFVEAVFFDFDGDGKANEAIVASPDQTYTDGSDWNPTRRLESGSIDIYTNIYVGVQLFGRRENFYELERAGVRNAVVARDVSVGQYDAARKYRSERATVIVGIDDTCCFKLTQIEGGLNALVSASNFRSLAVLPVERYVGFDMTPSQSNQSQSPRKMPGGKPSCSTVSDPIRFGKFLQCYRKDVKQRFGLDRKVTVYVVFFDADSDGDADFYITSDAEERQKGQYDWHLYIDDGGKFSRAGKTVWFNKDKPWSRESVEPDETAGKDSFYRVQRSFGFTPSVVILDRDGDAFHSRAHRRQVKSPPPMPPARHLSYEQGREYYRELEEWRGKEESKLGFMPAYDLDEMLMRPEFLRLERLKCEAFSEP